MVKQNQKKKNTTKSRTQPRTRGNVLSLARLIADPCKAELVHPNYGTSESGYLGRFRATHAVNGYNNGYIVMFPEYYGSGYGESTTDNLSAFVFAHNTATYQPANNNTGSPFGHSYTSAVYSAKAIQAPAEPWVAGTNVADARTVAACLRLRYNGKMTDASGSVVIVEDFPAEMLLAGGAGGDPMSVDEIFQYAGAPQRLPVDGVEVKFRPGSQSRYFRTKETADAVQDRDKCIRSGNPTTAAEIGVGATTTGAIRGILIAWRGCDGSSTGADFSLDLYQAIEWRPKPVSGLILPPPKPSNGVNEVDLAVAALDRQHPNWTTTMARAAKVITPVVKRMAQAAIAGTMPEVASVMTLL